MIVSFVKASDDLCERSRDEEACVIDTQDPPLCGSLETPSLEAFFVTELLHEALSRCMGECSFERVMQMRTSGAVSEI